ASYENPSLGVGLLGSLLVWLLTTPVYDRPDKESCGAHLLFECDSPLPQTLYLLAGVAARDGVRGDPGGPRANPPSGRPWPRIPQNIGYDPPLNAIAGGFSAPRSRRGARATGRNSPCGKGMGDQAPAGSPGATASFCRAGRPRRGLETSLHPGLRQSEDEDRIPQRIADLEVASRRHRHKLLTVELEHRRRRVGAGAAVELPQHRAGLGVVRLEPAVALAREHQAARGGGRAAHHRQLGLHAPRDLAGVQVDRVHIAVLTRVAALRVRDAHEGAAEPQPALLPRRVMHLVMHRLGEAHRIGLAQFRMHRYGCPLPPSLL